MRDVRVKAHVIAGLRVKIVQPKDEATGLTTEGTVAEILSTEEFDEAGVLVKLASGEEGRLLRIWEHGAPPLPDEPKKVEKKLPTYAEPKPLPKHLAWRIPEEQLQKELRAHLGTTPAKKINKLIASQEQGLGIQGDALKKYGITGEELAKQSKELLREISDAELEKQMAKSPPPRPSPRKRGEGDRR